MSKHLRRDKSALDNVLSLVEALLLLSQEQECESKLPLCVVWNADKLRITGYKSEQTRVNRSKTPEVGTKKEYLLQQIKNAGKTLKLPPQKAESNVSQKERELIDQEASRFRLRHKFVREELGDAKQQNSLFWLALKLGWLNEIGLAAESATKEKVYAFYHPTFEEYFAALAIDDWHEFLNHVPDNPALGVYRIFAPQWKEVILLWLGREDVGRDKKEEFIQALVEFDDGCGECRAIDRVRKGFYEFRAYFLAATGVDEWKNSGNADAIVAEIVKWRCAEFKIEVNRWVEFLTPIAKGAETALSQTNRIKAIAALVELIGKPQLNDSTRRQASSII